MTEQVQLREDEKVIAKVRKHWLMFAMEHAGFFIAVLVPVVLLPFASSLMPSLPEFFSTDKFHYFVTFALAAWLLIIWMIFGVMVTNYYLDILIVTDRRLIDIDQVGLFSRDIAIVPIENVEDIKTEVLGIIATIFRFGVLQVQTAGEATQVRIRGVRNPQAVKELIMSAYHKKQE